MKKKIVISGGNSFIGKNVIKLIDRDRYDITVLTRKTDKSKNDFEDIKYIEADMEDYKNIDQMIKSCHIYLPFAWEGTKREERNDEIKNEKSYHCILKSIELLLTKCGCEKVILPGTFSEYKNDHVPLDEKTPCESSLAYGRYKNELYKAAYKLCEREKAALIEIRLFSVFGTGDSEEKMLDNMLMKMIRNEDISLTPGEQIWDFVHVKDVAAAFLYFMENDAKMGCYNVATNDHRTLRSYLDEVKDITRSKSKLNYGEIPYENGEVPHVICRTDKILNETNWRPVIEFQDGVREMSDYYRRKIRKL